MKLITSPTDLNKELDHLGRGGRRLLVPTMGALHDGHLTLVKRARELAGDSGYVILTLFVNPTQFDQAEDLKKYPRTLEQDLKLCREHGVDLVFAPEPGAMYADNHSVTVSESALTSRLCGAARPGHFDGVCTVVLKLFNLTQADIAVFGKKDYQQLAVIRRMVRDLNVAIHIEGVETVREKSGLAMSSRNTRLTPDQLADAPRIRRALLAARSAYDAGETSVEALLTIARKEIESSEQGASIDYLELLSADSLQQIEHVATPSVMATAVFYDAVRLIDNIEIC
ncbi:MAG: pantoate--beta-alanine ligase [Verrucomicrobiae bacterium]|nr:pantoate--beta-alanine ligase [Verrucomicrobiae bacterium]NNJ86232.1 pantoate--beta-alanine ligase [Akkermansiaceae bacterium]